MKEEVIVKETVLAFCDAWFAHRDAQSAILFLTDEVDLARRSVLLAEDNGINTEVTATLLEDKDFLVELLRTGETLAYAGTHQTMQRESKRAEELWETGKRGGLT